MNNSRRVLSKNETHASRLIKAASNLQSLNDFALIPSGVWNRVAIIESGNVKINADDIDFEFTIPFDNNLESNESEIIIYNLSDNTINQLKDKAELTITAGYKDDTGVIFKGHITKKFTKYENSDKITTIKCSDDIFDKDIKNKSYGGGRTASYILKDLLTETGLSIAKIQDPFPRDWTYRNSVIIDEPLESAIKKYSQVCGVSTFVGKEGIYCQSLKNYTDVSFTVSEETGMIGSPSPYTEELTAEDYTDTIEGYEIKMLLQYRISAGKGIKLKSKGIDGTFRVRSGEHVFNESECTTKIKVF